METKEQEYVPTSLKEQESDMLQLLEKLVNIDSGSYDKEGVDRVGRVLQEQYAALGFHVQVHEAEKQGAHLVIQHERALHPKIMILLHMDTVFPQGTAAERPFRIAGDKAHGPGVVDMKASHVSVLYMLKTLLQHDEQAACDVQVVCTSDEEIGAVSSRQLIEAQAKGKACVLVMEPARADGSLVSARKGGGRYTLNVQGKAAHSGINPEKGRSAIEVLARKITRLHALTDMEQGITVNVGLIEGGTSVNTVAPHAYAEVDIRISALEQAAPLAAKIEQICAEEEMEGTSVVLKGDITRPPMVKNEGTTQLLSIVQEEGKKLGLTVTDTKTGGGSDASFTSALGIPTLDGLGPVGGNAHSEDEYMEIPTLVERTVLLAKTVQRLHQKNS